VLAELRDADPENGGPPRYVFADIVLQCPSGGRRTVETDVSMSSTTASPWPPACSCTLVAGRSGPGFPLGPHSPALPCGQDEQVAFRRWWIGTDPPQLRDRHHIQLGIEVVHDTVPLPLRLLS
jgi:hypothetical protein